MKQSGQALVEYLIVLLFIGIVGNSAIIAIRDFTTGNIGQLNHVLSRNLTVGVCANDCFFSNYKNGYSP